MNRQREENIARSRNEPLDDKDAEVEANELDFFEGDNQPTRAGDKAPQTGMDSEQGREAGLTGGAIPGRDRTKDDMAPDVLINEDGARRPGEPGKGKANDQQFSVVDESEIGGGDGLDEAELARAKPLDGKPWDGEEE